MSLSAPSACSVSIDVTGTPLRISVTSYEVSKLRSARVDAEIPSTVRPPIGTAAAISGKRETELRSDAVPTSMLRNSGDQVKSTAGRPHPASAAGLSADCGSLSPMAPAVPRACALICPGG
jgi:hypothetical protein